MGAGFYWRHERTNEVIHSECFTRAKELDAGTWAEDWLACSPDDRQILQFHGAGNLSEVYCLLCGEPLDAPGEPDLITHGVMEL